MATTRVVTWFIQPIGSHTNEVLSDALRGLNSSEKFSELECSDGEKREICEVPDYPFVTRFLRSKRDLNLDFHIYRTQGNGKPTRFEFPTTKKKTTVEKLQGKDILTYASSGTTKPLRVKRATQF